MIRAVVAGIAFGLCVAAVDTFFGGLQAMKLNMPVLLETAAQGAALTVGLGAIFGLVLSPLRLFWKGWLLHALAMAAGWAALAHYVALDPSKIDRWLMSPAIALGLLTLGALIAKKTRIVAWALGLALFAGAIAMPVVIGSNGPEAAATLPSGTAPAGAPDVVIIVLDTVRAKNISAYGYERATTPAFDRLTAESALFLDATSPSTWSLPSHASLFTGLFPSGHGAHGEHRVLTPDVPTLAEVLGQRGYETQCFTANPHISDSFGLTRGFQQQDRAWAGANAGRTFQFIYRVLDLVGAGADDKGGGNVVDNFEHWLALRADDAPPAFAFLNFLEAHFPYHQTPPRFLARYTDLGPMERRDVSMKAMAAQFGRELSDAEAEAIAGPSLDMYDAGVSYSDFLLERVVDALREADRLDRTFLVVLADHGEMIGEHREFGHGPSLYQPDLHVPLLLRYPDRIPAGLRVARPVSTVGVYASVLDLVGIAPPRRPHVASLLPVLVGGRGGEPVMAERFANHDFPTLADSAPLAMRDRRYRVYRRGSEKVAVTSSGDRFVFDLDADPDETENLADRDPAATAQLVAELETWVSALGLMQLDEPIEPSAEVVTDPAAEERLRALGYVD